MFCLVSTFCCVYYNNYELSFKLTRGRCVVETSDLTGEEYAPNDVDYEDVVQGLQQEDVHIYIDVREFDEVKETGRIPHSKVVPREFIASSLCLYVSRRRIVVLACF